MKAWGYIRYSTEKQGENSVERQMDAVRRWAKRSGVEIAGWSSDLETSRTTDHDERPGLMEAIAHVNSGSVSILVAETVSRFAGSPGILHGIRKAVKGRVSTADESGNADFDEDMQDIAAIFSRREIKQLRDRTRGALAVKRMRGERVGQIPYGKRLKADGQHTVKDGHKTCPGTCTGCLHLQDSPEEIQLIARIHYLNSLKKGPRRIARILADEGLVGRVGKLSHKQVARLLDRTMQGGYVPPSASETV